MSDFPGDFNSSRRVIVPFTNKPALQAGNFIRGPQAGPSTGAIGDGQLRVAPWTLGALTIDQLLIELTIAAAAGGFIRFAVYNDTGAFYPGSLLFDSGQIASDTIGFKTATAALTLPAVCWVGGVNQGGVAPATARVMTIPVGYIVAGKFNSYDAFAPVGYSTSSAAAALPNPFPAITDASITETGSVMSLIARVV